MNKKCPFCNKSRVESEGLLSFDNDVYSKRSILKFCGNCGICWVHPLPDEQKLSKIYSGVYHYSSSRFRDLFVSIYSSFFELESDFRLILKYKKRGRVLDIGFGRGDLLSKFSDSDWEKWGFDPYLSAEDVRLAKEKLSNVNNYQRLRDYPREYFDVVILRNVIEHTTKFVKLMREVYKILKKDGILFIRTPNIDSIDYKIFKNKWYVLNMSGHLVFFSKKSIVKYLRKAGFKKIEFNKPTQASTPLSLYRSIKFQLPSYLVVLLSLFYSFVTLFLFNGGDIRVITKK